MFLFACAAGAAVPRTPTSVKKADSRTAEEPATVIQQSVAPSVKSYDENAPVRREEGEDIFQSNQPPFRASASAAVVGAWTPVGPRPTINGQVENVPSNDPVVGAIHVVLAHPTDADILYIGAVNGGVWKTSDATSASPTWTPLTDSFSSLSISALVFDVADPTHQTVIAANGRFSSFGRVGGERAGLLRSTDGGASWVRIDGGGTLQAKNISGIAVQGSTFVVAVEFAEPFSFPNIGIFRSTDGGGSFTQISNGTGAGTGLPGGLSFDLAQDPTNPLILYTSMLFADNVGGANGIYKSTDFGATWTKVSNAAMDAVLISGTTSNVEIAVGAVGQVYVAILNNGQLRNGGIFRSGNGGSTWQTMDIPLTNEVGGTVGTNPRFKPDAGQPGGQGAIHFSIVADPVDPNIVYVGGDRQPRGFNDAGSFPNAIGAFDFSGRLFRGDASQAPGSQWVHLTHSNSLGAAGGGTASSSAPHADSREMTFRADGVLIEVDDGGIYRRTNPRNNTGDWFSLIGNLQVTELHDIAYDSNANIIIGGAQDTGSPEQLLSAPPPPLNTWDSVSTGDGGDVAVDDTSTPGFSIRYSSFQFLGAFRHITYDASNAFVSITFPALTVLGGGTPLDPNFSTPLALCEVDMTRLVLAGTSSVYESFDRGETLTEIGAGLGIAVTNTTAGQAIAYGASMSGVPNPDVLYLGTFNAEVYVRTSSGGPLVQTLTGGANWVRDVEINDDNWMEAFALDFDQVFHTTNAGATWTDVTGDLTGVGVHRSLEFIPSSVDPALIVGTDKGVFVSMLSSLGTWTQLGTGLPVVPVFDMDYDPGDNILVIGTLGRGAWTLSNPVALPCTVDADCDDATVCTRDRCVASACQNTPNKYGDVNADGVISVFDLFCILDALNNIFVNCAPVQVDITGGAQDCTPDTFVTVFDLFGILDALNGIDPCCGGLP